MTIPAKIKLSISQGIIEIEGSEEFVTKQFAVVKGFLNIKSGKYPNSQEDINESLDDSLTGIKENNELDDLIFSKIDEELRLVCNIPGKSKRSKTTAVAMLLSYGYSVLGEDSIDTSLIRKQCKSYGCYSEKHFADSLKDQTIFLIEKNGNAIVRTKLTRKGVTETLSLIKSIIQSEE